MCFLPLKNKILNSYYFILTICLTFILDCKIIMPEIIDVTFQTQNIPHPVNFGFRIQVDTWKWLEKKSMNLKLYSK